MGITIIGTHHEDPEGYERLKKAISDKKPQVVCIEKSQKFVDENTSFIEACNEFYEKNGNEKDLEQISQDTVKLHVAPKGSALEKAIQTYKAYTHEAFGNEHKDIPNDKIKRLIDRYDYEFLTAVEMQKKQNYDLKGIDQIIESEEDIPDEGELGMGIDFESSTEDLAKRIAEEYKHRISKQTKPSEKEVEFLRKRDKLFLGHLKRLIDEDPNKEIVVVVGMGHISGFYEGDFAELLDKEGIKYDKKYLDEY